MHPDYLSKSLEVGYFLPEKDYEWSEKWIITSGPNPTYVEKSIWPGSCRRGRIQAIRKQLPFQDLKILLDLRCVPPGVTLGPPLDTLRKIIECGGGEVIHVLTGEEESGEVKEVCERPEIDYVARYPCSIQVDESVEDQVISSNLVNVLLTSYFLDRISMEKVDIRDYIVTREKIRNYAHDEKENQHHKRQKLIK